MKCLVIIPAYNEEKSIESVYNDIKSLGNEYDYIFVNDGSKDKTKEILDNLNLNHLDLPINLGLSGAVQAGYKYAYLHDYDAAVQFDGDGQHRGEYLPIMFEEIKKGEDIVIGSRFVTEKKDFSARMIGSRVLSFFIKVCSGRTIKDPTSGLRMLNRKMIKDYAYNMNRNPEPDALCYHLRKGARVKEIQVKMNERTSGESYLNPINSIKYMLKMIVSIIFLMY